MAGLERERAEQEAACKEAEARCAAAEAERQQLAALQAENSALTAALEKAGCLLTRGILSGTASVKGIVGHATPRGPAAQQMSTIQALSNALIFSAAFCDRLSTAVGAGRRSCPLPPRDTTRWWTVPCSTRWSWSASCRALRSTAFAQATKFWKRFSAKTPTWSTG